MGRVRRPLRSFVVIVLALLLMVPIGVMGLSGVLGGGDDAEPTVSVNTEDNRPTVDPDSQPPRPEIAKPAEPDAVRVQDAAGAEATLTYLLESYTYMMTSGDTSVWQNAVDPSCQVCTSFLANAELLKEQGGYLVDGEFEVETATFEGSGEPPTTGVVTAAFTQEASTIVDDPTRQAVPLDEVTGQIIATVVWDGERWLVSDMSVAPPAGETGGGASDAGGEG